VLNYQILDRLNIRSNIIYRIKIDLNDELIAKVEDGSIKRILNKELDRIGVELTGKGAVYARMFEKESGEKTMVAVLIPYSNRDSAERILKPSELVVEIFDIISKYDKPIESQEGERYVRATYDVSVYIEKRLDYVESVCFFAKAYSDEFFIDHYVYIGNDVFKNVRIPSEVEQFLFTQSFIRLFFAVHNVIDKIRDKISGKKPDTVHILQPIAMRQISIMANYEIMNKGIMSKRNILMEKYKMLRNIKMQYATGWGSIYETWQQALLIFTKNGKITNIVNFDFYWDYISRIDFFSGLSISFAGEGTKIKKYLVDDAIDNVINAFKYIDIDVPLDDETTELFQMFLKTILLIGRDGSKVIASTNNDESVLLECYEDVPVLSVLDFR